MGAVSKVRRRQMHQDALEAFGDAVAEYGIPFVVEWVTLATTKIETRLLQSWTQTVVEQMQTAATPNGDDPQPTEAEPGSAEKLALFERRLAAGQSLHHREDRQKIAVPLMREKTTGTRRGRLPEDDVN